MFSRKSFRLVIGIISFLSFGLMVKAQQSSEKEQLTEIFIYQPQLDVHSGLKNRNVSVLNQQQIKALPVTSVAQALSYISGVDIRSRGPFSSQSDLSIDGGGFDQNIILINGQSISDAQTGHNSLNIPISLDLVERIEVIKGPAARLYGANSLTGVVNIVTKQFRSSGLFASALVGSNFTNVEESQSKELYNNRSLELGGNIASGESNHLLFGNYQSGNGSRYNTDFNQFKFFYQGNIKLNNQNSLQVLTGYAQSKFGANGFYAWPGDKESQEVIQTSVVHVKAKNKLSTRLTIFPSLALRYNYDDYRFYKDNLNAGRSRHYTTSGQANIHGEYVFDNGSSLNLGAQLGYDQLNSTNMGDHHKNNYGLFAQYSTYLWRVLEVNLGSYANYNNYFGWQFYPGVDVDYLVNSDLRLVMNLGSATRLPTFTDLHLNQLPGNIGNPDLGTEKAYQAEIGAKYNNGAIQGSFFGFYRNISDFIDWVRPDAHTAYQPFNSASNKTFGLNAMLGYQIHSNQITWNFVTSYTYLDPRIKSDRANWESKYILDGLKHQFIAQVGMNWRQWSLMVTGQFKERFSYKSYWDNNLKLSYNQKQYQIYLDVQNFTSTTFIEAGIVPLPKAWFTLGVKYNTF
ncbi:TonB-dependent receptor plug domain-containing protein [Myroides sp. LJL119]